MGRGVVIDFWARLGHRAIKKFIFLLFFRSLELFGFPAILVSLSIYHPHSVKARSVNHNLSPSMANLSHTVNHLSFGQDLSAKDRKAVENAKVTNDGVHITSINLFGSFFITKGSVRAF